MKVWKNVLGSGIGHRRQTIQQAVKHAIAVVVQLRRWVAGLAVELGLLMMLYLDLARRRRAWEGSMATL